MKKFMLLSASLILSSCTLFLSPFSAESYKYLVELKVMHLKFIETFTQSEFNSFDSLAVNEFHNRIELKFREAIEYQSMLSKDKTRLKAFKILFEEYYSNYVTLKEDNRLYDTLYARLTIKTVSDNYDTAIKGELSRPNKLQ